MKTVTTIIAVVLCMLTIGGASAVAVRPHDCLLLVEKAKRRYADWRTQQYVNAIIEEQQCELRKLHQ